MNPRINYKRLSVGVGVHHWVVIAVGVAVEALRRSRVLHLRVGREKAGDDRVVQPGVHVDDAETVVVLVPGEAPVEQKRGAVLCQRPVARTHPVPPRIVVAALHHRQAADHPLPTAQHFAAHNLLHLGIALASLALCSTSAKVGLHTMIIDI